jgi:hypothetical protein
VDILDEQQAAYHMFIIANCLGIDNFRTNSFCVCVRERSGKVVKDTTFIYLRKKEPIYSV